jgi:hypothetical protein
MSCSTFRTSHEIAPVIGDDYTTLIFELGETTLSKINQNKLERLLTKRADFIDEIRVMAWPDDEYDPRGQSRRNISLAAERGRKIKDYINRRWPQNSEVIVFNMARGPGKIDQLLNTKEQKIKSAVEKTELSATILPDGRVSYTKGSKAIVIIEKDENI